MVPKQSKAESHLPTSLLAMFFFFVIFNTSKQNSIQQSQLMISRLSLPKSGPGKTRLLKQLPSSVDFAIACKTLLATALEPLFHLFDTKTSVVIYDSSEEVKQTKHTCKKYSFRKHAHSTLSPIPLDQAIAMRFQAIQAAKGACLLRPDPSAVQEKTKHIPRRSFTSF